MSFGCIFVVLVDGQINFMNILNVNKWKKVTMLWYPRISQLVPTCHRTRQDFKLTLKTLAKNNKRGLLILSINNLQIHITE